MDKPRFRFTVISAALALAVGFLAMPALNIVKVDARGMGHERTLPWQTRSNGLAASILAGAVAALSVFGRYLTRAQQHPLFRPALGLAAIFLLSLVHPKAIWAAPVILGATATEGQHAGEFLLEERMEAGRPSRENVTVLSGQNLKAGAVIGRVKLGIGRVSIPTVVGTGTGTATVVFAGPEVEVGNYVLTCITAVANNGVFSLVSPSGKALPNATMAAGTLVYTSRHINFTLTDSTDFIVGDVFTFVVSTTAPTVIGGTGTGVMTALSLGPDAKPGRYQVINRVVIANGGDFEVIGPDGASIGRFNWSASASTAAFTSRHINFTLSDATDYIAGNYFDIAVFNNLAGGKVVAWDPTNFDGRHVADGALYDNVDASSGDLPGVIVTRDATFALASLQWGAAISESEKVSAQRDLLKRQIVCR